MQHSSVLVSSMLQCSGGDGGGHGGSSVTLLTTLLFGVVVAFLIFIDDFGHWRQCFCCNVVLLSLICGSL